jgi:hypothetical protein
MTEKAKSRLEIIGVGSLITILFAFSAYLNNVKAEKEEVHRVDQKIEKACEKQDRFEEIIIEMRLDLQEIKTLIKEREKR